MFICNVPWDAEVFPARAGMILSVFVTAHARKSIPRESGDDPCSTPEKMSTGMYSPRERG